MCILSRARARASSVRTDTRGSVTIEFVLWVPVFMGLILLAADTSIAFMRQTDLWTITRDTARIVARHGMTSEEAADFIKSRIGEGSAAPQVDIEISGASVSVTVAASARDMAPFGLLRFTGADRVVASVTQAMEPI